MKGAQNAVEYISNNNEWASCLDQLREIILSFDELKETIKWGIPVYVCKGKNVIGLASFKHHCALWFYQGALLKDKNGILINAGEGKTKTLRQWRFTKLESIIDSIEPIKSYIAEAIENCKLGKEIKPDLNRPLVIPQELQEALDKDKFMQTNFENFSLSKKRDFAEYIETAKRAETKITRLQKIIPMIEKELGLHDKYK
jgi:uncharacterized protein YdeI (YjbR/CyaY-like superfamily)